MTSIGMKFFTFDRLVGKAPGIENAQFEYRAYLETVRERLPGSVREFLETASLVGNCLTGISARSVGQALFFDGRLNEEGPARSLPDFISLKYSGHSLRIFPNEGCVVPGATGFGEVLHDEFEVFRDEFFAHNLILSSGIEISVMFKGFMCLIEYRIVESAPEN